LYSGRHSTVISSFAETKGKKEALWLGGSLFYVHLLLSVPKLRPRGYVFFA
jgi:hypothetical protein